MKKDLFLEYYVIENIVNKLNENKEVFEKDFIILKDLNNIFDNNNIIAKMIVNNEVATYSDYAYLLDMLGRKIYNDYGILL